MIEFSGQIVLLDIEGTVSPLAFVHEVMFPFARREMRGFLEQHMKAPALLEALEQMARDAGASSLAVWCPYPGDNSEARDWIVRHAHALMDADVKQTGLKLLQGLVWERGFRDGSLCATLFPDVASSMRRLKDAGLELRIYSSGSVHAQRLFFAHTEKGNLTPLLSGFYDTAIGSKRETASYAAIAADAGVPAHDILFLSDVVAELDAAHGAGMRTGMAQRPGNPPSAPHLHPVFSSLEEIAIPQ